MKYTYVGKIVSTHGIKGEIRIISNFDFKEEVFKPGISIYIGPKYEKQVINSYRHHKKYEMITLKDFSNINEVLKFMNYKVYIIKEEVKSISSKILKSDIIGMEAFLDGKKIGIVSDIYNTGINYEVFEIIDGNNKKLIPYHRDFIKNIDLMGNKIYFKGVI